MQPAIGDGGSIVVSYSDNNGLDWKEVARVTSADKQQLDLSPLVVRRYDYRLKFEFRGLGTGLDALKVVHDIQHSQRPLPALDQGSNTITFDASQAEGTITIEGATNLTQSPRQLVYTDFHPEISGFGENLFVGPSGTGAITFPVATPGDLVRLRFGAHYRAGTLGTDLIIRCLSTEAKHGPLSIALRGQRRVTASTLSLPTCRLAPATPWFGTQAPAGMRLVS